MNESKAQRDLLELLELLSGSCGISYRSGDAGERRYNTHTGEPYWTEPRYSHVEFGGRVADLLAAIHGMEAKELAAHLRKSFARKATP